LVSCENETAYIDLAGKQEGTNQKGISRSRREYNSIMT
jgi:hypothetical protein